MPTSGWWIDSSPALDYGERWARHWLDLVRYAETSGHEFDYEIPNAYRYRDYVIRALNADVPYDRFLVEHLAGDLLDSPRRHPVERFNESIIATGFYYLGEGTHSPVDVREEEVRRIDNQIDVISKAFLGLTVACARCHDHKFDPIAHPRLLRARRLPPQLAVPASLHRSRPTGSANRSAGLVEARDAVLAALAESPTDGSRWRVPTSRRQRAAAPPIGRRSSSRTSIATITATGT